MRINGTKPERKRDRKRNDCDKGSWEEEGTRTEGKEEKEEKEERSWKKTDGGMGEEEKRGKTAAKSASVEEALLIYEEQLLGGH